MGQISLSPKRPTAAVGPIRSRDSGQVGPLCSTSLQASFSTKIPIAANRVSRNFWAQRITLAHARCVAANIVHRFHEMKRHVFGPSALQHLYYFEPYFGQVIDPIEDSLPE